MKQEAQAIVLAGGSGSRMTTLIGGTPKCLLPIGNFPMIYYSLYFLQEAGFTEVTLIVSNNYKQDIQKVAEQYGLKLKVEIVAINTADHPGTLDALKQAANKIKKSVDEVIVMSSDLITDVNFYSVMEEHRSKGAALTMLTAKQNQAICKAQPPGPKSKNPIGSDIICSEEESQRLLYAIAGGDYEDVVNLPARIVSQVKEPCINFSTSSSKFDAHFYVMKRWLVEEILSQRPPYLSMDSLKAEVIPQIISDQFSKDSSPSSKSFENEDLIKKYNSSCVESRFHHLSTFNRRVCYAYHHPGLCLRVNTLNTFWQINKEMHKLFDKVKTGNSNGLKHESADINGRAQICEETLIGRGAIIEEKTNVTSSIIGNHCRVKPLVRISNSLLFDYVTIEPKCVVENSIICTSIDKPCTIKNCVVVDATKIEVNGTYLNEILEASQDFTE